MSVPIAPERIDKIGSFYYRVNFSGNECRYPCVLMFPLVSLNTSFSFNSFCFIGCMSFEKKPPVLLLLIFCKLCWGKSSYGVIASKE